MKKSFEEFLREKYGGKVDLSQSQGWIKLAEEWHKSQEKSVEEIEDIIDNLYHSDKIALNFSEIKIIATAIHTLVYGVNEGKGKKC